MKIKYLDGERFYRALQAGAETLAQKRSYLNKINVFPVPDGDTGNNMVQTFHSALQSLQVSRSLEETLQSFARNIVMSAKGNSGMILAQFIYGLSEELKGYTRTATEPFSRGVKKAVEWARKAIAQPKEGTILSVLEAWAKAFFHQAQREKDIALILPATLEQAQKALHDTPNHLPSLAEAGVVDAGAAGFVTLLEGIVHFIRSGTYRIKKKAAKETLAFQNHHEIPKPGQYRYCCETLLVGAELTPEEVKKTIQPLGDSAVVVGGKGYMHLHLHTNHPPAFFEKLEEWGTVDQPKVDDMVMDYRITHQKHPPYALVTDTGCDLPEEIMESLPIQTVPLQLQLGKSMHLDKKTLTPDQVYAWQKRKQEVPTTSQPSVALYERRLSFLQDHYENILIFTLSKALSGTWNVAKKASEKMGKNIVVVDTRGVSIAQGLVTYRAAQALEKGESIQEVLTKVDSWIQKTRTFIAPKTLDSLIRSGRVKGLKASLGRWMGLVPLITLNEKGEAVVEGVHRGLERVKKIIQKKVEAFLQEGKLYHWGIAHVANSEEAHAWGKELEEKIFHKPPFCIVEAGPAIGVHGGLGTLGLAVMLD